MSEVGVGSGFTDVTSRVKDEMGATFDSDDEGGSKPEEPKRSLPEALEKATAFKETGNAKFKAKDTLAARIAWADALKELEDYKILDTKDVNDLLISLHGNLSMVFIKEEDWTKAIANANKVLTYDSKNVKALFRRGVAHHKSADYIAAKSDLTSCLELDPNNSAAKKELVEVTKALKEHAKKQKAAYTNMFSKSMYEDKEKERQQKLHKQELARQQEQDDYIKSKLSRRERGLEEVRYILCSLYPL